MQNIAKNLKIAIVIPLYNHGSTIANVAMRALNERTELCTEVWIVDDGSTDNGLENVKDLDVKCLKLPKNMGKGNALREAAKELANNDFTHMIKLDADNQHYPEDIPLFLGEIQKNPFAFLVGARNFNTDNVPRSSRFGRAFSEFWMFVQTGTRVLDMQSGFRAYPLQALLCLPLKENRYSFVIEVLVQAAWTGFAIVDIPIKVLYQKGAERVSHFKAFADNLRITILNTRLTIRALVPIPFRQHLLDIEGNVSLLSPLQSLKHLLKKSTPLKLSLSAAISLGICTLPLLGLQSILLLFCIQKWHLDRLCALAIIPLSWPPFLPGLCVLVGYRVRYGQWLTEFSIQTLGYEIWQRILDWIIGAIVLAPVVGALMAALVLTLTTYLTKDRHE